MTAPSDPTGGMEPIRQIAMEMMRRCGTCDHWTLADWDAVGKRPCLWPKRNLPYAMRLAPIEWTGPNEGTDCATWKDRAEAALREAGE